MPNTEQLQNAMPVAPVKLLTTKSALPLAHKVNQHLVEYRRSLDNTFKKDPAFHGYMEDDYLIEVECPASAPGNPRAFSTHPSVVRTSLSSWMCAITALPTR